MYHITSLFRKPPPDGGRRFGDEEQDTSSLAAIVAQSRTFHQKNLVTGSAFGFVYSFNRPSSYKYSASQWLWDSGAHQITWVALGSADLAVADLRTQLLFQLDNGRIPQQINWQAKKSWRDPFKPQLFSKLEYNDLTQTPVLPYSLRSIYKATGDIAYLEEMVPKLVKYFNWWKTNRDLDGTGVVTILHPWESGMDLSPGYDVALGISADNRARPPWRTIYPQLIQLCLSYHYQYGWEQEKILRRTSAPAGLFNWFKVQDVAVNCIYASGWGILGDLAAHFDIALATECHANQKYSEKGILETLFSESAGYFVTGFKDKSNVQSFHNVRVVQMLFPLLLDSISIEQVARIVEFLTDEGEFGAPYPIPAVSKAEAEHNPVFDTDLLWRGPSWGFTNWFIMEGLEKHDQIAVLNTILDRWISAVQKGGIWEMWNSATALGYGAEGLGMSALIVDWMQRLGRV
ncbi:hypothetical protein LTR17_020826 [Elasticomyces elasticus]|nr:hypothetical protein LTR17_020826 [Elasticomyces elasticus]